MRHLQRALLFLLFILAVEAKQPQLSPRDVKFRVEEIFKAHVSYKELNPELVSRTLQNFLDELDPAKTYFIKHEIQAWVTPSEATIQKILREYKAGDFSSFQEITDIFLKAVARRNSLQSSLETLELPKGVKSDEFKEIDWAADSESLANRLLRIKALQINVAEKLGAEAKEKFAQRLEKKRLHREAEFLDPNLDERKKLMLSYILKSITASLDSHTNYLTPNEANQFVIQVQQRLFGIGALLRDDLDGISVVRILENSPASQSTKLRINDKIIAVNSEPVVGMDISEVVELIRGEAHTPVKLTLLREVEEEGIRKTEKSEIELIRNEVVLDETRLEHSIEPYGDGVIATLRLFSFYQDEKSSSSSDIRKVLEELKKQESVKAVILDLRGNGGGLLVQGVAVTGLFIDKGIVVSVKENTGKVQHLRELEGNPVWKGPLFVLVNRASASTAEIVAQTLQDYGRALVIGEDRTFGKGSFQTFTLDVVHEPKVNPKGEYKVTRGRYYTVSGKSPQLKGVKSDIVIPGLLSYVEVGEQYGKFPLDNEEIEPHFEDDLSDLSPFHKIQMSRMYKHDLQKKLTTYVPYLDTLTKNSQKRIQANKNYQKFLEEADKKNFDSPIIDLFSQTDLQLIEANKVVQDYLFLSEKAK